MEESVIDFNYMLKKSALALGGKTENKSCFSSL